MSSDKCPVDGHPCDKEKNVSSKGKKVCDGCDGLSKQWAGFLTTVFTGMHLSHLFSDAEMVQVMGAIDNYKDLNYFLALVLQKPKISTQKVCKCGTTLEDMMRTGRMGCPNCYANLQPFVSHLVFRAQDASKHAGKKPKDPAKEEDSIETLQAKMDQAIREERYEEAAKIRDALQAKTTPHDHS